jgi:putative phosphoribosyl transferase
MDAEIPTEGTTLAGELHIPKDAIGVVAFAHGTGSGRFSPRNQQVAAALRRRGLGTLLMDLLTEEEERVDQSTAHLRFDIGLLADRMTSVVDWLAGMNAPPRLPIGLFGASTGAAAALVAAARRPDLVRAVVSRGGRPDLARDVLPEVRAPTLLIVGGNDELVLELNRAAMEQMTTEVQLVVVPGATHLFEEPRALDEVARLAADWFTNYLGSE